MSDFTEDLIEDIFEEFSDFLKDLRWHLFKKNKTKDTPSNKQVPIYGGIQTVRPAYVFAERIDNALKMIFGFSIIISAIVASFWGVTRLSELLEILINNFFGRFIMGVIGISYLIIGIWKLLHVRR